MDTEDVVAALSALAQDSRLAVFRLLVAAGPSGLSAGRISEALAIPANTLSFHLAALKNAGLVRATRTGRSLIYAAAYQRMNDLLAYLTENCCGGVPCLDARTSSCTGADNDDCKCDP